IASMLSFHQRGTHWSYCRSNYSCSQERMLVAGSMLTSGFFQNTMWVLGQCVIPQERFDLVIESVPFANTSSILAALKREGLLPLKFSADFVF
ncbi:hypothetical protein PMAYCL1PPCAC_26863, partial [Pristionchus mayeri]